MLQGTAGRRCVLPSLWGKAKHDGTGPEAVEAGKRARDGIQDAGTAGEALGGRKEQDNHRILPA